MEGGLSDAWWTDPEILSLRGQESRMVAEATEADRLCRDLMDIYVCDWVIAENLPLDAWASLPRGWQMGLAGPVEFFLGHPAHDYKGAVAVSLATLRRIAREAR